MGFNSGFKGLKFKELITIFVERLLCLNHQLNDVVMEDRNDGRCSRLSQWMFLWRSCAFFFLETAEHFMCCVNTCEVLKAVHILEIYIWKNSQNKKEVCRRHALQLSYLFTQTDRKIIILPVVFSNA